MYWKKQHIILCTLYVTLLFTGIYAQDKRLEEAHESFDNYEYINAREIYIDVVEKGYESTDLFSKIGDSFYFNGDLENALLWYERLVNNYPEELLPEYLFRYAQCLKSAERYMESDDIMEWFTIIKGDDQRAEIFRNTRDYLKTIEMTSGKYNLLKLNINTPYSEYAPSFDHQGQLVFASARGEGGSAPKKVHEWNKMPFLDLFTTNISYSNTMLKSPKKIKGQVNTKYHESSSTFSKDGRTMYFTRNNYNKRKLQRNSKGTTLLKLYKATLQGKKWTNIKELPFNSDEYTIAHPSLSADGKKLYFASDMPGTRGKSDLFVVDIYPGGRYGKPKNLGDQINTEARETFPYISDSGTLYFASDGYAGLGGLDVYVSTPDDTGNFALPQNVGKPINSAFDDFSFVLNEETQIGYFASNRKGGLGNDDIYSFKASIEEIPECDQIATGIVMDSRTNIALAAVEVWLLDKNNTQLERTYTDSNGAYRFEIACEEFYIISVSKEGYFPSEVSFTTDDISNTAYTHTLALYPGKVLSTAERVTVNDDLTDPLLLNPIHFNLNSSYIRKDAAIELQKIIATLERYPNLKIRVQSHADSRSSRWYNKRLSERRAQKTVRYLTKKGNIASHRIQSKAFGESLLINNCTDGVPCSEKEHQRNRRSEFIVISQHNALVRK